MNYKDLFIGFWAGMQDHPMIASLAETVESSSWHREANVFVHTTMVVNEFLALWTDPSDKKMYLAALAAMFHDVGKPGAEEERVSEERGVYRRYAGHEHLSATAWLDFILSADSEVRAGLELTGEDVYLVAWMIEYHLPYTVRDKVKRQGIYSTPSKFGALTAFVSLLRADARGRISDGHEQKLFDVELWIKDFLAIGDSVPKLEEGKTAYVLVGTSSAGKSTKRRELLAEGEVEVFSQDDVRMSTFPTTGTELEQYEYAFKMACADDTAVYLCEIDKRMNEVFARKNAVVVSDNCNLSKKARNAFVARARQGGYKIVAVLFLVHPSTALARQHGREDRAGVPIWQQFRALTVPTLFSEADEVQVVGI